MEGFESYKLNVLNWLQGAKQYMEGRMDTGEAQSEIEELEHVLTSGDEKGSLRFIEERAARIHQLLNKNDDTKEVPAGQHKLPPLPYPYDALEPYISKEIMMLHHDKHHQSYVDGLNKAELKMKEARDTNDFAILKHWEREAAFHGSGHYLHTMFWEIMDPKGGGEPKGPLANQIKKDFGSFRSFKKQFTEAAKQVTGVGWAILVWAPRPRRLEILQTELHMLLTQWDTIPLLAIDVWEHAYYLQYKNERNRYIDNWWNVVNWPAVEKRFAEASQLKWKPF